ncbi:aldehyde dehydrogenase family protein [Actinocatenispora rupis]|uniref:Aldehyde dehydrogenase n=1 Tax=Actinocatenispora rupis TaxID=519421 RepID=A0A8J3J3G5_9ACTN|nr:aldehyde dehydrogenase family protein [Actinocatenispora rupis]GID09462.1 aldehyde dehydrogenase [Actinocatenispora rupis]
MSEPLTIGGRAVAGTPGLDVVDPATGRVFATAPACTDAELSAAVDAAHDAWPAWRVADRGAALTAAADAIAAAADDLAPLLTAEQGKPLADARAELVRAADRLRHHAFLRPEPRVLRDDGTERVEVRWRPVGPVAAIAPWNFPVQLAAAKIAPALAAGNTVVLKPSPYTPLTTLSLGRLLAGVLPPGVLNVVSGPEPLGERLVAHPGIRQVTFTGSVATGRRVAASAGPNLRPVTLELGGNDAAIVLPDADVPAIADALFWSAFANCGQICMAVKRVYVAADRHDELVDALAARAASVPVGAGSDPGTRLGPLTTAPQYRRVAGLVAAALSGGARAAAGGGPLDRDGYFHAPTILTGVADTDRIVTEEQFGPALPVLTYDSVDEAVARANATPYGLCGSVWGVDVDRAVAVAERLQVGTAWVNSHLRMSFDDPFAGTKDSGLGVSGGEWGVSAHTEPYVLHRPS